MNEMKSLTLNGKKYDSFLDQTARQQIKDLDKTVGQKLPVPPKAAVGQYLQVKEVDTNGVVTAIEAVDAPGGGNADQSGGLSATAKNLLISILRNAIYQNDQSAIIAALKTALEEGGSSGGGDSGNGDGGTEEPGVIYHKVLVTATKCVVDSSATSITDGGVFTAQITPDNGYTIETVTVTMGGKDVTSTAYSNGSISISKVTGDIVVVATAMETPNDLVYSANWTFGKRQYSATGIQDNDAWTSSDWIDVTPGQVLTVTLLKTNEIDSTTYNWNGENLNFGAYFRDYSGAGVTATIPSTHMNLREDDDYPSSQEIIVPDGAVELCCCVSSMRSYFAGVSTAGVSCENLDGRPVWWSLVLSNGGAE